MITLQPVGKAEQTFSSLDAAYRYIVDSRIRHWSLFDEQGFVMASDNTYIPAMDEKRDAEYDAKEAA